MIEKYVDASDLKRLLAGLAAVLCILIIMGLFASIVIPGLRNANKPATPTAVSPVVGESGWLDPTEFPPQKGSIIPPVDPQTLIVSSPELKSRGKILFEANCVQCHGRLGRGDGPSAISLNPPPRNLSSPDGWKNGDDLPGIYKTLKEGIKSASMVAFDFLPRKDRMALAHYVQSLGSYSHKTGSVQAMESLSKELASPGEKTPNKIPVSMAMAKLEEEFKVPPPLVLEEGDRSPGGIILRRVIVDPSRAATTLMKSKLWRVSAQDLAAGILRNTPANGFSNSVATLFPSEWKTLHAELLKRIKPE
jgi:mono/diheme cytochrome c family protein